MVNALGIVAVVLLIIIVYFFIRMRQMMKNARGARNDMNTFELIKNWQQQKAAEAQYQAELKEYARRQAEPEIAQAMVERYKQEEIAKATASPGDKMKNTFKQGLGIDTEKVFSKENIDRVVGTRKIEGIDPGVDSSKMFTQDRINRMTGESNINQDRIKQASGGINWDKGVRRGLDSGTQFNGLNKALGRDRPPLRKQPPYRP